jgi:preprotein translocase subunit SecA
MFAWILKKIVGNKNQRELRRMLPSVKKINELEVALQSAPDEALRAKTLEWKDRLSKITDSAELARELDSILPEAFAVVKNGARRLCGKTLDVYGHPIPWNMIHFDVQLIGGMVLHKGRIAEMATGEG